MKEKGQDHSEEQEAETVGTPERYTYSFITEDSQITTVYLPSGGSINVRHGVYYPSPHCTVNTYQPQ